MKFYLGLIYLLIILSIATSNTVRAQMNTHEANLISGSASILENGDFELAASSEDTFFAAGWVVGGRETSVLVDDEGEWIAGPPSTPMRLNESWLGFAPHSGQYALTFGDINPANWAPLLVRILVKRDRAWQLHEIPKGERATLRLMYRIVSHQSCGNSTAKITIRELTRLAETLATFDICQANQSDNWQMLEIDLSAYMGKEVFVQLESIIRDTNTPTAWIVDSVELVVDFTPASDIAQFYVPIAQSYQPKPDSTPFVLDCKPSGGSGGRAPGAADFYDTEIAGLRTSLIVGRNYDPAKPTLLTFYLHGDTGDFDTIPRAGVARRIIHDEGWIHVGVLAPNLHGERFISWKEGDVRRKLEMLTAVFDEIYATYNVCQGVLLGAGASGGSVAYTGYFLPLIGDLYPSFFLAKCGGTYPPDHILYRVEEDDLLEIYGQNPHIAGRLGVRFVYSHNDFVAQEVEETIEGYRGHGIHTEVITTNSSGHCGDPVHELATAYWLQVANTVVMP